MQPGEKVVYIEPHPCTRHRNRTQQNILEREILLRRPKRDQWKWFSLERLLPLSSWKKASITKPKRMGTQENDSL